jgi:hypothetical protein
LGGREGRKGGWQAGQPGVVVHACNPSYSGGRHQEDHGAKPARQIVHKTLSQKNPIQNKAG